MKPAAVAVASALLAASLGAASPAPAVPAAAPGWRILGVRTPGGLLSVRTGAAVDTLVVDGIRFKPVAPGRFLVPVAHDAASAMRIEGLVGGTVRRAAMTLAPRAFPEQRLPALGPGPSVDDPERARRNAERALLARALAAAHAGRADADGWRQPFIRPADGRISGVYGARRFHGGVARSPHLGLDIAAPSGTVVRAPAAGIVRLATGPLLLQGNIVVLDHGGGLVSAFLHLSRIDVAVGERVARGEPVGAIGSTGRSTGPHLHWNVGVVHRAGPGVAEVRVDPALLIPAR